MSDHHQDLGRYGARVPLQDHQQPTGQPRGQSPLGRGTGVGEWAGIILNLAWIPENEQRVEKTDAGTWTLSGPNTSAAFAVTDWPTVNYYMMDKREFFVMTPAAKSVESGVSPVVSGKMAEKSLSIVKFFD